MTTTIELVFINEEGKNSRISLNNPNTNLTPEEVKDIMDEIIAVNVFTSPGGDYVEAGSARIITREVAELF
ncbi:MAG TPA: DUF2922 domain-containing protein [Thermoanaerobacterales bacterium]|nr:DUF2922 domain-containing protein [Thermoanaerobacterales bacterium]